MSADSAAHLAASPLRRAHLSAHLRRRFRRKKEAARPSSPALPPGSRSAGRHHVRLGCLHPRRQGQGELGVGWGRTGEVALPSRWQRGPRYPRGRGGTPPPTPLPPQPRVRGPVPLPTSRVPGAGASPLGALVSLSLNMGITGVSTPKQGIQPEAGGKPLSTAAPLQT